MNNTSNTITPVYFPFTFISDNLLRKITTFWEKVVVYQPSGLMAPSSFHPWVDQGFLKIRTPLEGTTDKKRLQQALRSFQCWGEMHQKSDIAYLKTVDADPPYLDTTTSGIVADLKGYIGSSQTTSVQGSDDKGFSAQLFLHLAQDYDQRSHEVTGKIQEFERNQNILEEVLHPFPEKDNPPRGFKCENLPLATGDKKPQVFMMEQRVRAWDYLFQQDGFDTDFLFTDSREALLLLLGEEYEKFEILRCGPSFPSLFYSLFLELMSEGWSDAMREKVSDATRDSYVTKGQGQLILRCYLVPDQSTRILLGKARSTEGNVSPARPQSDTRQGNTLLGLLEWED